MTLFDIQEQKLKQKAKKAKSCLDWTGICNADCCRVFSLELHNINPEDMKIKVFKGEIINLRKPHTKDRAFYYKLHGVKYQHSIVTIDTNKYKKIEYDKKLRMYKFFRDCDWLIDKRCKGHPDKKPDICKAPDETKPVHYNKSIIVNEKCLGRYK